MQKHIRTRTDKEIKTWEAMGFSVIGHPNPLKVFGDMLGQHKLHNRYVKTIRNNFDLDSDTGRYFIIRKACSHSIGPCDFDISLVVQYCFLSDPKGDYCNDPSHRMYDLVSPDHQMLIAQTQDPKEHKRWQAAVRKDHRTMPKSYSDTSMESVH